MNDSAMFCSNVAGSPTEFGKFPVHIVLNPISRIRQWLASGLSTSENSKHGDGMIIFPQTNIAIEKPPFQDEFRTGFP